MVKGMGYIKNLGRHRRHRGRRGHQRHARSPSNRLANVHFAPDLRRGALDWDGKGEAVGGIVVMRYGENALTTIQAVKAKLEAFKRSLPPGVKIVTGYDRSDLILRAISNLKDKLIEESIIVSLVCILFLFHFRSALVAILVLPIAILLSFIAMVALGVSSNIMSLGGIAIAIGAMVDAAVVMIENAHKWLERWNHARAKRQRGRRRGADRSGTRDCGHDAPGRDGLRRQTGRQTAVLLPAHHHGFVPAGVCAQAQSGRLFKPLAYTKTFSMFFAALLSVSIVPILMVWFIRGKITAEHRQSAQPLFLVGSTGLSSVSCSGSNG